MAQQIPIFIAAAGNDIRAASALKSPCAYLAYTVSENSALLRFELPNYAKGGILGISDYNCENISAADPLRLSRDIAIECTRRGFRGVLIDFENPNSFQFASNLSRLLAQKDITHYVPLVLASAAPAAKLLISSAISGGSFYEMLSDYCEHFSADRLALDVVRVCSCFDMPSYSSDGQSLSAAEFREIMQEHSPSIFFSKELCAKYFTYHTSVGDTKFVLFDDIASTSAKIELAASCGFCASFVLYRDFGGACAQLF